MSILITGNTEILKESDLINMFPEEKVIVLGKLTNSKHRIRRIDWEKATDIGRLLTVYNVTSILYFSKSVEPSKDLDGELLQIRKILNAIAEDFLVEFLYVTGPDSCFQVESSRSIMLSAYEQLIYHYSQQKQFSVKILHSLYSYQLANAKDYLRNLLTSSGKESVHPEQKAYYIFGRDLLDLCRRIFDNWDNHFEMINIPDSFNLTFRQIVEELQLEHSCSFLNEAPLFVLSPQDSELRKRYGWFPKVSVLEDLSTAELSNEDAKLQKLSLVDWVRKLAKLDKTSVKVLTLLSLFMVGEILSYLLSNQMYFKTVDYRLFVIVISGISMGMVYGIGAGILASVGLIIQNILAGETNLQTLFFEPSNWIPYIIYFVSGLVSGYVKEKDQSDLYRLTSEKKRLTQQVSDEQAFVEDLLSEKVELTHQILDRQDSYGRIYRFLEALETPYLEIFMVKLLDYISDTFETEDIAIYKVNADQTSKLQLTTAQDANHLELNSDQLAKVGEQLVDNTVWVNQHLRDDYPMYLAGIFADGDLHYYLSLDQLPTEKLNLYHQNLLKSLMGLASLSYQRLYQQTPTIAQHNVLQEEVFYQKITALKEVDSPYFVGQVLTLGVAMKEVTTTVNVLQDKLSVFDSLGWLEDELCLLINTYANDSLERWQEELSQMGIKITD